MIAWVLRGQHAWANGESRRTVGTSRYRADWDSNVEFGTGATTVISKPAPRQVLSRETHADPVKVVQPHLWRHLCGYTTRRLMPLVPTVKR